MSHYLLDTDGIIDFLFGKAPVVSLFRRLYAQGNDLCSSDVVIAEIYSGLHPRHRAAAEAFLSTLLFLPTDLAAAQQAGEWRYQYARQGMQLATTDCLIAATAVAHQAQLVTGNVRHFPMPELTLLSLPKA